MRKSYLLSILWAFSIVFAWGQNENWIDKADISWYTDHKNEETYKISTAAQLAGLAKLVNEGAGDGNRINFSGKTIQLIVDISLNDERKVLDENGELINDGNGLIEWTPIGGFDGTFDGNRNIVKGIYINEEGKDYRGMFSSTGKNGEIRNFGVVDSYIKGRLASGGICGLSNSPIINCYNAGSVAGSEGFIGGICGQSYALITNCYNTGNVAKNGYNFLVGGICGQSNSSITNCYNTGYITGSKTGGICGQSNSSITNCYNTGYIAGSKTGGICGEATAISTTFANYLAGSAEKGIGDNRGGSDATTPLTAPDLVAAINEAFKDTGWQGEATYKDGILTLPTLGSEIAPIAETFVPDLNNNEYEIRNADHLRWFAKQVNEEEGKQSINAKLMNDITLSNLKLDADGQIVDGTAPEEQWTPIGAYRGKQFTGIFDGNGYTVKGVYIKGENEYIGLFGRIGPNGGINNLGVADSYIEGCNNVGGICGTASSPISNCYNAGSVKVRGSGVLVGGICGDTSSLISSCYNTGSITGSGHNTLVGGICGAIYFSSIINCYNMGSATGSGSSCYVGGICGYAEAKITSCYNAGYVTDSENNYYVGGVCGYLFDTSTITNSSYLAGSTEKGAGYDNNGNDTTAPLTASDLVAAINEAFKGTGWQGEATYKDGILTLPSLGNETVLTTQLATLTENEAIGIDYTAETITVKGNSKFDVSYATDFNSLISTGNVIHPEEIIYVRHTGGSKDGLISDILKITLPARPATPKAPTTAGITTDAITLNTTTGSNLQYSRTDGRTWQTSPTFSNLMPETNYTFLTRIQATSTGFASNASQPATFRTAEIEPISYSYTIPNAIGAIVEGAGSNTAREGSRITFKVKLDPNGNGIYPAARINNEIDVRHEGNGYYSFYISTDSEVSIDEVNYTLYNVTCPNDTVFDSITDTYSTGAGIRVTDAQGRQANAFPYGSTIRLNAPDNTFRRFRHWWDLSRNRPYELVLTDHLEATAIFEALHPVANETISIPGLRITSGHGYVEVETPQRLPIRLYHISGRLLHQADQAGTIHFGNLTTDTYLLTAGTERQLILVR
ncbi:MAG: fibronectin type III domain-containing protein [Parabacteroides gordonii]|uniref:fibronectin type III domain-containing protein n=1 Tax=Parabacteroides gordonii TaxID=574930 RepID=UPI003A867774